MKNKILFVIEFIQLFPIWVLSTSPTKKNFKEFVSSLKIHEHEYDYSNRHPDGYYKCKHLGCNCVDPRTLEEIEGYKEYLQKK